MKVDGERIEVRTIDDEKVDMSKEEIDALVKETMRVSRIIRAAMSGSSANACAQALCECLSDLAEEIEKRIGDRDALPKMIALLAKTHAVRKENEEEEGSEIADQALEKAYSPKE